MSVNKTNIIAVDCENILNSVKLGWQGLKGKNIFLTGGTGFFGKWFLHSFNYANEKLDLNATMTVLSRNSERFLKDYPCFKLMRNIKFIDGDVRNFNFPIEKFNYAIHAATPASAKLEAENPNEMYSIIVDGTKHVLDFAKQSGVSKLLLTSSGAVYGVQPPSLPNIDETYPPQPVTAYGKGKLAAEDLCLNSDIDTVIARCFAFVGPYLPLDIHYAIGNFIRDALNGDTIVIKGDGHPYRSYLYAADLMTWLWTILLYGLNGAIYNVGSEKAITIEELARTVSNIPVNHVHCKFLSIPTEYSAQRYVPNIEKIQKELGLIINYSLIESLQLMFDFYINDN